MKGNEEKAEFPEKLPAEKTGKVWLVGAGPGDRGLLTVRGRALVEEADVVVHDRLVSEDILMDIPPGVRLMDVGKFPGSHPFPQEEIHRILIAEARRGLKVVRLKGGDPLLFGRGAEEILALSGADIPWELVPGVSSALAVPALAGISLTRRGVSSGLHIITWRDKDRAAPGDEALRSLSRAGGTLVILMGGLFLNEIGTKLIEAGFPEAVPAAIIENGSGPRQRVTRLTLKELAASPPPPPLPPTLVVLGPVCSPGEALAPPSRPALPQAPPAADLPLAGLRILITRPEPQNAELCRRIQSLGGEAIPFPCIKIAPSPDLDAKTIREAAAHNWLVFTSAAGVNVFFDACLKTGVDIRSFAACRFAVIGPATGEALSRRGFIPDYMPPVFNSAGLARGLGEKIKNCKTSCNTEEALLARSRQSSVELPEILEEQGIRFREMALYDSIPIGETGNPIIRRRVEKGGFDMIFFSSPAIVSAFAAAFPGIGFSQVQAICIGSLTARRARELGMKPLTADEATVESMCALAGRRGKQNP
jgi:uroporphyrinogen III methyltransferase/synthase